MSVSAVIRTAVAGVVSIAFIFPLYIALVTSLDKKANVFTFPPNLVLNFDFRPYLEVWGMGRWLMYLSNTLFITATTILIALATTVLAAYALSFLKFKSRDLVFFLILAVLMVPAEALLIPNYVVLHLFGLLNTRWAQILPFGGSAFGIFLLRQFFLSLPQSYWDSARMDGAGHLRFLWNIALPLCRPTLFTLGLFIFIGCWNSFQWPLIVTVSHSVQPLEVEVSRLMTAHSVDWRRLSAAGIMTTMPLVVLYLFLQKYILQGIRRGDGMNG